jgi:hypothetical protein
MHRRYRAGETVEDVCRACKTDRLHTVVVVDPEGVPIRVLCDYCRSEHNYRGGPRIVVGGGRALPAAPASSAPARRPLVAAPATPPRASRDHFAIVSERERSAPAMPVGDVDLEMLLRRIIREETGLTTVTPAEKWRGGTLVLRPGNGTQERSWPVETFFHKIVMIRNRLRMLEQQVNAMDLPEDVKLKLQSYITGCYGSLTSFNVLFADEDDHFRGAGE